MRGGLLIFFLTALACLAQSDANQGFVNQHLFDGVHLLQPLAPPRGQPARVTPLSIAPAAKAQVPCMRIAPQERIPVDPKIDPKILVPAPANIDRQMLIAPPPACPEP